VRFMTIDDVRADTGDDRYFAESATPLRPGTFPVLLRRRRTGDGYVDETWAVRSRKWALTGRLSEYWFGGADNELESIDEARVKEYMDLIDRLWPEARNPRIRDATAKARLIAVPLPASQPGRRRQDAGARVPRRRAENVRPTLARRCRA